MRRTPILILTAVGALALAVPAIAKPDFVAKAKANGIPDAKCTTCHVKMGSKDLNEVGKVAKASMKDGVPNWDAVKKAMK
jgi:hypothetical protein